MIAISELFMIDRNTEADRQTVMRGWGRVGHVGLAAVLPEAFETIPDRLVETGASNGTVTDTSAR